MQHNLVDFLWNFMELEDIVHELVEHDERNGTEIYFKNSFFVAKFAEIICISLKSAAKITFSMHAVSCGLNFINFLVQ